MVVIKIKVNIFCTCLQACIKNLISKLVQAFAWTQMVGYWIQVPKAQADAFSSTNYEPNS